MRSRGRFWSFSDGIFPEETSVSETGVMADTVFNDQMRPVMSQEPADVRRRLLRGEYPEGWSKVLIGATGEIVTIPEYLFKEKYQTVVKTLYEILKKSGKPMYQNNPERLDEHIQRSAKRLINLILEGEVQ